MNVTLTPENPISKEFTFSGSCAICASGVGEIRIQRKVGEEWYDLTDIYGDPVYYVAKDGLLFNGDITGGNRVPHRVKASTTGKIKLSVRGA